METACWSYALHIITGQAVFLMNDKENYATFYTVVVSKKKCSSLGQCCLELQLPTRLETVAWMPNDRALLE
jgi:hypothetical protein